jgi:hypothetical protein
MKVAARLAKADAVRLIQRRDALGKRYANSAGERALLASHDRDKPERILATLKKSAWESSNRLALSP